MLEAVQDDVYGLALRMLGHPFALGGPDLPLAAIPFAAFIQHVQRGTYKPAPAYVFEFDQIVAAHQLLDSGNARGKIVVRVS